MSRSRTFNIGIDATDKSIIVDGHINGKKVYGCLDHPSTIAVIKPLLETIAMLANADAQADDAGYKFIIPTLALEPRDEE